MSNLIPEGTYNVRVVGSGSFGKNEKGELRARVNVKITDGEHAGRGMTYEERLDAKSEKYLRRSLAAAGWKGKTFATVGGDVTDGHETTAEVVHLVIKQGARTGETFAKVRGLGGLPPLEQATRDDIAEADAWIPAAADDGDIPF